MSEIFEKCLDLVSKISHTLHSDNLEIRVAKGDFSFFS